MRNRFQSVSVATIFALLVVVLSTGSLKAQLVVESVSIAHGAVNVPEVTDISVTFSEALDPIFVPSALETLSGSLPIDLNLFDPECPLPPAGIFVAPGGCPESVDLSTDGKTVTLHNVQLESDMPHTLLVLYAQGQSGATLAVPSLTRFSTGPSLPQGGIEGAVSSSGPSAVGTLLLAVEAPLDLAGADTTFQANIGFADLSGNYGIDFVEDGTYFVVGLQIDLTDPDAALQSLHVGTVDGDSDHIADEVVVSGGALVTGADVSLTNEGATAAELNTPALNLVHLEAPGAQLALAAGAGLNLDGTALTWVYLYTALGTGNAWGAASLGSFVFPPQLLDLGEDANLLIGIVGATPVPADFGDSDGAIDGFLDAGGSEFLAESDNAIGVSVVMNADLFAFIQMLLSGGDLSGLLSPVKKVLAPLASIPNLDAKVSKRTGEVWIVAFVDAFGPSLHMVAMDDAGSPLLVLGSSAARPNEGAASAAATAWAGDAVLVNVSSDILPIDGRGSAIVWGFDYYSASKDSVMNVVVSAGARGGVLLTSVLSTDAVPSLDALPDGWIDSPEAIQAGRPRGEVFFALHPDASATATLSRGLQTTDPDRAVWRLTLTGTNEAGETESVNLDIDAVTGVYVAVEDDGVQPSSFELGQNYPNPFNPSTVIPYRVDERSHVSLEVFDALGRRVATLVDREVPAGSYEAVWDASETFGTTVPSGVYLYRLRTERSVKTRTMMVLK